MDKPKYKLRQRFMIGKAIYIISEVRYDPEKDDYLYMVNSGLFGYYESQLKEEYFHFVEPKIRFKRH